MLSHPAEPSQEGAQCRHLCSLQTLCPHVGHVVRKRNGPNPRRGFRSPKCHYLGREASHRIRTKKKRENEARAADVLPRRSYDPLRGDPHTYKLGAVQTDLFNSNRRLLCAKAP